MFGPSASACRLVPTGLTGRGLRPLSQVLGLALILTLAAAEAAAESGRRVRDHGIAVGVFPTGPYNGITDVKGVRVGHSTLYEGDDIRTGITAIIPGPGNLYTQPVPAWIHVANGYGKLVGETQVREFGEIETPILLTCTLCVWRVAQGLASWMYDQMAVGEQTVNPVVGETNDSHLNNMWADAIGLHHVYEALSGANEGPVLEGSIGAGTGTQAFGWKGGIGSSSRQLPVTLGGWTVGVLVQTNFGGNLTINGAPVGRELGRFPYQHALRGGHWRPRDDQDDGSIIIVVATDAPIESRNLSRLAQRAIMGLARTGSFAHNGSGDYVIAFSNHPDVRRPRHAETPARTATLSNAAMSPLFAATAEATEEAIYNAMFAATTVRSSRGTLEAIPKEDVLRVLRKYNGLYWGMDLPPGRIEP